jgi:two-component system cell cycle sensor histidine kinase/response regulator CckA
LWAVSGDATQLHQVLLNLCVNARDAIMSVRPPADGSEVKRVLTVAAENAEIDEHFASMNPGAQLGPHVVFRVTDTGAGMSAETQEKIFDPFFTTKEPGKGTGLGLATVIGIVKSHGGFLNVQSEMGHGTTFRIFLPATRDGVPAAPGAVEPLPVVGGQGEIVLVVDDEAAIREALVRTLEANGYRCFTAEDGSDALALYFQRREEIALVISDLAMAQMDGIQLVRSLRRINPNARIIVSSGHLQKENQETLQSLGVNVFLDKPYSADKMLRALHEMLHPVAAA